MMYPLVRDLAAKDAPVRVPITVACRVLGFSPQAFHKWVKKPVSDRDWAEAHLINAAFDAHRDDPTFGYRFIADELADQGFTASERRVWRICAQEGLWSVFAKKKGRYKKPGPPVHDDRVQRVFTASRPNELWLTDITEHKTSQGKLYLCAMKDGRFQGASATPSPGGSYDCVLERPVRGLFDAPRRRVGAGNGASLPCKHGSSCRVGEACRHGDSYGSSRRHRTRRSVGNRSRSAG
jgi:putative transposase